MCGNSHPGWLPRPATPVLPSGSGASGHLNNKKSVEMTKQLNEFSFKQLVSNTQTVFAILVQINLLQFYKGFKP